jgi:uncharacterized membrane protein
MFALRAAALLLATMATGLAAGVFGLYQHTIMRGLGQTDDRTFVAAFQAIDRAIINPWFMASFLGAVLLPIAAAALNPGRAVLPWVLVALALSIAVFAITVVVNVPLNDALKAAGDPARIDVAEVRRRFDEARWVSWNLVRTIASTAAFASLSWALVALGRTA